MDRTLPRIGGGGGLARRVVEQTRRGARRGSAWRAVAAGAKRGELLSWIAAALLFATPAAARGESFGLEQVAARAAELAKQPYSDQRKKVPDWMLIGQTSYDQWRDIRFRPERALWAENRSSFQVQFFHVGLFYDRAVKINVFDAEGVRPVQFSPSDFDYGQNDFGSRVPQGIGFAGFRLHYPIRRADYVLGRWLGLAVVVAAYAAASGFLEIAAVGLLTGHYPPQPVVAVVLQQHQQQGPLFPRQHPERPGRIGGDLQHAAHGLGVAGQLAEQRRAGAHRQHAERGGAVGGDGRDGALRRGHDVSPPGTARPA